MHLHIYWCIRSRRDRLGFYAENQIIFGPMYTCNIWKGKKNNGVVESLFILTVYLRKKRLQFFMNIQQDCTYFYIVRSSFPLEYQYLQVKQTTSSFLLHSFLLCLLFSDIFWITSLQFIRFKRAYIPLTN